jgi:hypothetical protein
VFQSASDYVFVEETTGRTITVTLDTSALRRFDAHQIPAEYLAAYAARWGLDRSESDDTVDLTCAGTIAALYDDYCASCSRRES